MQKCDFNKDAKQCAHIIVMFIQKTKKDIAEVHIHVTIHSFFLFNVYGYLLHSYITATIDQKLFRKGWQNPLTLSKILQVFFTQYTKRNIRQVSMQYSNTRKWR